MLQEKIPSIIGLFLWGLCLEGVGEEPTELDAFGDQNEGAKTGEEDDWGEEDLVLGLTPFLVVLGVD